MSIFKIIPTRALSQIVEASIILEVWVVQKSTRRNNKYCDHCQRTNHTSENCWIKHGLPTGYKNNFKNNFGSSKPSVSVVAESGSSVVPDLPAMEADKPSPQFGFSKEQYQAILALLPHPSHNKPLFQLQVSINALNSSDHHLPDDWSS
ncbi:hypothetical protein SESBI_22707 [Sesbania bispinosa]|nr:hypothetical protein SESBI_22707 [Sesbania bispinosa]